MCCVYFESGESKVQCVSLGSNPPMNVKLLSVLKQEYDQPSIAFQVVLCVTFCWLMKGILVLSHILPSDTVGLMLSQQS